MRITHWLTWGTLAAAAGLACGTANAQERGRVLQSVPVVQQVGIPQQVCGDEPVYRGQQTSGAGAVIGALVGGVAGNALGTGGHYGRHGQYYGSNRGATTVIGAVAGGLIGNQVEGMNGGTPAYQTVRRCTNETVYENRTVGYDVTYEYAGQRHTTRMDHNPGPWVPIQVPTPGRYSSAGNHNGQAVTPGRSYQSTPQGSAVTESITYTQPSVPIVIGVDVEGGRPSRPPHGHRPPPPPPPHWR